MLVYKHMDKVFFGSFEGELEKELENRKRSVCFPIVEGNVFFFFLEAWMDDRGVCQIEREEEKSR